MIFMNPFMKIIHTWLFLLGLRQIGDPLRLEGQPWRRPQAASRPRVIRKSAVAVTLLLFLAAGAAGCGVSGTPVDSPSSPLGAGGDSVKECVPDPSGTTMTNGWTVLENHSTGTAVVE